MPRSDLVRPHNVRGAFRDFFPAVFCALVAIILGTSEDAMAQEALLPGQAFVTQFSGTTNVIGADGVARTVIDVNGASGVAVDLRAPGFAPDGRHWMGEPHPFAAIAGDVGQVFGVALDDAPAPNIYLAATALFGLHRNLDNSGWMEGMWGRGGGPGTVYKLNAANGYQPEVFTEIALNGRPNSGAALGNIAFDRWNRQFYVSDLETGMIHRIGLADGADVGQYDHGVSGRSSFFDAVAGASTALPSVAFDPVSSAHILDCPTGDFARTVSCWNMADFRRRVFGLGVRRDATTGEVRLHYSVWSSHGFGNTAWATAGDDQKNTLWSVAIGADGEFDLTSVRREAVLPDFFVAPEDIARSGYSHPVADIAFPAFGDQTVMLLAERGGVRNLGLSAEDAFATPHEARVLRYEIDARGVWQPVGRYDVGFYDRQDQGTPYIRANAAGGVVFGFGYDAAGAVDLARPNGFVWLTGDALCSPAAPCFNPATGVHDDQAEVDGIEGRDQAVYEPVVPDAAFQPYPSPGPATPASGPDSAFMVDSNFDFDAAGNLIADLGRNDATRIGDIAIYQMAPIQLARPAEGPWYGPWDGDWPWPLPGPGYEPAPFDNAPELAITKTAPPLCDWETLCTFLVTVTNNGPGPYVGPVHIVDTPDHVGIDPVASPGWTCEQPAAAPGPIACRHAPVTLVSRDSINLALTMAMPVPGGPLPPWPEEHTNCSLIAWPQALDGPARIRAIEAALLLNDIDPGPVDGVADAATRAAIDDYRAANGLAPGGIDEVLFASLFPDSSGMAGDDNPGNDIGCAPFYLPGTDPMPLPPPPAGPDLVLEKELVSPHCVAGEPCEFRVRIRNDGGAPYAGVVEFIDTANATGAGDLLPSAIHPASPTLGCIPAAGGGQRCRRADVAAVTLLPGTAEEYLVHVDVPAGAAGGNLQNCGFIRWNDTPMPGGDDRLWNDHGCIDVAVPPVAPAVAGPDLALAKEVQICGFENAETYYCQFWITVSNAGTAAFSDVVRLHDEVPGAADLTGWGHDGDPSWSCEQSGAAGSDVFCTSDEVLRLDPEASKRVNIRVTWPAVDVHADMENCVDIDWGGMAFEGGRDDNPGNEHRCVDIPPVEAAAEAAAEVVDLEMEVWAFGDCMAGDECGFHVGIINRSERPYSGPVVFRDWSELEGLPGELPDAPRPSSGGGWGCSTENGVITCRVDVVDLEEGHDVRAEFQVRAPEDGLGKQLTNIAVLDWTAAGGDGDANRDNDSDRASRTIAPAGVDLAITKSVLGGQTCHPGEQCAFVVNIENPGPDFEGTVVFEDFGNISGSIEVPATAIYATGVWDCTDLGETEYVRRCSWTGTIAHGERQPAIIYINVTDAIVDGALENCAEIAWDAMEVPGMGDDDDTNDGPVCATATIEADGVPDAGPAERTNEIDLRVEKRAPETCVRGEVCEFTVTIVNNGPGSYVGPLLLHDRLNILGEAEVSTAPPSWNCFQVSANLECLHGPLPGEPAALERFHSLPLVVEVRVPDDYPLGPETLGNCAEIDWVRNLTTGPDLILAAEQALAAAGFPPGAVDGVQDADTVAAVTAYRESAGLSPGSVMNEQFFHSLFHGTALLDGDFVDGNNRDCVSVAVVARGADISIISDTSCQRGASCPLETRLENVGTEQFEGSLGMRGQLSPAVPITSVTSQTPGVTCSLTDEATYECFGEGLSIEPGGDNAVRIEIIAEIPDDFEPNEISHIKKVLWPDPEAQDGNATNDRHISTILIEGPEAPQQAAAPDLAVDKVAEQGSCVAGQVCPFVVTVTNVGAGTYVGPIRIADVVAATNATLSASEPSRWSCRKSGATTTCTEPSATLAPGESTRLSLSLTPPRTATGSFNNCASLAWNDTTRTAIVQNALNQLGFDAGPVDGKVGPRTHGAVHAFEERAGLPATAQINPALLQKLFGTWATGDANAANDEDCAGVVLEAAAAPTIDCQGGTVRNNQCICLPGATREQVATHAWRCVTPRPVTTCVGGTIQGNRCVCPAGSESQPAAPGAFRCVATTPSLITCTGGSVVNNQCACPKGTIRRPTATNSYRCVRQAGPSVPPIVPQLTCQGGTVQQGQCVCPAGKQREQVLPGVFRCLTVAPSIQCGGGKVENNRCVCPQGMEAQLRAPNIYKCVAPAPSIRCSGGSVQNNQCVCPQGMRSRKVSDRVYRCVKSEGPSQATPSAPPTVTPSAPPAATAPTCTGGSVTNGKCVCPAGTRRQQTATNAYRCAPLVQGPLQRILPRLLHK